LFIFSDFVIEVAVLPLEPVLVVDPDRQLEAAQDATGSNAPSIEEIATANRDRCRRDPRRVAAPEQTR